MEFDKSYYEKYSLYQKFIDENQSYLYDIKIKIKNINNNCINKNFIFIYIFEKWIKEKNIEIYDQLEPNKVSNFKARENKVSFEELDLYPFKKVGSDYADIIPIIDMMPIFDIINNLEDDYVPNENKLKTYYEVILKNLVNNNSKAKIEKIDSYGDKSHAEVADMNACLYTRIIATFEKNEKQYLVQYNQYESNKTIFKGKNIIKDLLTQIEELKNRTANDINRLGDVIKINYEIIHITKKIIEFFNILLAYTTDLKIKFDRDDNDTPIQIKKTYTTSFYKIDDLIENLKPAFKKSYIVKENNLTSFIKMKISYYTKDKRNFVEINDFDIPYNNVVSLEHDVDQKKINVTIIDTEGELSNLLIHKIYQISQTHNQAAIIGDKDIDNDSYDFEIEYGWTGPETEDEYELIREKVFSKKKFRGYITELTSQFTLSGTQYNLTITPNDSEKPESHMNYYDFFYSQNNQNNAMTGGFLLTLIFLYFILKYSDQNISASFEAVSGAGDIFTAESFILEKIFFLLNGGNNYSFPFIKITPNTFEICQFIYFIDTNNRRESNKAQYRNYTSKITKNENKKDYLFIEKLISGLSQLRQVSLEGTFQYINIFDIKIENLKNIMVDLDESQYALNSWLTASYFIWKIKRYFSPKDEELFLFYDRTDLFNLFINEELDKDIFLKKINDFNVFCFEPNTQITVDNFFTLIKKSIQDDNFNKFNRYDLALLNPFDSLSNKNPTLFTSQVSKIFSSLRKMGHNKPFNEKEMYQFANEIKSDFMTYKDLDFNYYLEILNEYRKKIYSNANISYLNLMDENITHDKIFKDFYRKYKEKIETVIKKELNEEFEKETKDKSLDKEEEGEIKKTLKNKLIKKTIGYNINILYLDFEFNSNKILKNPSINFDKKIEILSKKIVQSYSLTPRIYPKTRNSNKQFFSQGNDKLLSEGTGDIIEFQINEFNIQKFNSLMVSRNNQKKMAFNNLSSSSYSNIYQNAAKYYNTYIDIDGQTDKQKIVENMANLDLDYQNQTAGLSGSITIPGEPFWSEHAFLSNYYIYLNIYYNSGNRSSHSGVYSVKNVMQNIDNGSFKTKIEIIRIPTFLNDLDSLTTKANITMLYSSEQ